MSQISKLTYCTIVSWLNLASGSYQNKNLENFNKKLEKNFPFHIPEDLSSIYDRDNLQKTGKWAKPGPIRTELGRDAIHLWHGHMPRLPGISKNGHETSQMSGWKRWASNESWKSRIWVWTIFVGPHRFLDVSFVTACCSVSEARLNFHCSNFYLEEGRTNYEKGKLPYNFSKKPYKIIPI